MKLFSNIRHKSIEMNVLSEGLIPSMYHITKTCLTLEELTVASEITQEIIPSNLTDNQSKVPVPDKPVFVESFKRKYYAVLNILEENQNKNCADVINEKTNIEIQLVLDLYDGARIMKNHNKKFNVISFSLQIFNKRSIWEARLTASSGIIQIRIQLCRMNILISFYPV